MEYRPPKIELGVPEIAMEAYERLRTEGTSFRMNESIQIHTGLDKIEATNFEEEVEKRTLERVKEIQESAYQEAYQLGLEEGRKEAFQANSEQIDAKINQLQELIGSLTRIKTELLPSNERHLIELAFHMAQRLAAHEISINPEATVSIVRQAVEMAQGEEKITVQVNPGQVEFLETLKSETSREFEFLQKVKLEPNEGLGAGGCVVLSNYGEVDSRIEERVAKLWEGLAEILPRSKDKVSAA